MTKKTKALTEMYMRPCVPPRVSECAHLRKPSLLCSQGTRLVCCRVEVIHAVACSVRTSARLSRQRCTLRCARTWRRPWRSSTARAPSCAPTTHLAVGSLRLHARGIRAVIQAVPCRRVQRSMSRMQHAPSVLCSKITMTMADAIMEHAMVTHKSRVKGSAHLNRRLRTSSVT
jgi:hypothetical protein